MPIPVDELVRLAAVRDLAANGQHVPPAVVVELVDLLVRFNAEAEANEHLLHATVEILTPEQCAALLASQKEMGE